MIYIELGGIKVLVVKKVFFRYRRTFLKIPNTEFSVAIEFQWISGGQYTHTDVFITLIFNCFIYAVYFLRVILL